MLQDPEIEHPSAAWAARSSSLPKAVELAIQQISTYDSPPQILGIAITPNIQRMVWSLFLPPLGTFLYNIATSFF